MNTSFNYNYYPSNTIAPIFMAILFLIAAVLIMLGLLALHRRRPRATIIGAIAAGAGVVIAILTFYQATVQYLPVPVFAPKTMLQSLWENYKKDFVEPVSGRTIDTSRSRVTTSEGEGYTMLRAVWMDDQPTFDASWTWTQKNLARPNDHLFAWLYGTRSDGTLGILTDQNGQNSASDADTDIALALVFAYSRWQDPRYLRAAVPIIRDIWSHEVVMINGRPYLVASNAVATSPQMASINPSYFAPYAYRVFAVLDPTNDWHGLIDASYVLLDKSMQMPLDRPTSAELPPDWITIDTHGTIAAPSPNSQMTTNFGYDALRVPWRIALDEAWNNDSRAQDILTRMGALGDAWKATGALDAVYAHDGTPVATYQSPAMYGGTIGYFMAADPEIAKAVYLGKLQSLYNPDTQTWKLPLSYYDANLVWFGMALYNSSLPNLFALNTSPPL